MRAQGSRKADRPNRPSKSARIHSPTAPPMGLSGAISPAIMQHSKKTPNSSCVTARS